ncbi:MAG: hypothetical protein COU11_01500 [Candidatus Harrisonbacteria bacterium CG10_big_fil_rev_8_21_14_0_10_49_15]|uniref:Small-conductance mechanosensitive ion channel n=1 Tax=Candidatus Harrisonbacteria bacterium CG10_big_fil_rev_8_21_14_0_10_49_15 TaxID=1974587 RepID=A0A2H0ULE3_9BACT|nr:MAG: hypothetical protein COU11_01500 [Candidatus Harrisonbacteria bacterium CG10_big_fil_rev_8_21_14_0_10_49_15]
MENNAAQMWLETTYGSLGGLWQEVLNFLPALLGAIVILLIGLIVAAILERIVERVIYYLKIDELFRKAEIDRYFERANIRLNIGHFLGKLVYWFIVIAFILAASDFLAFDQFAQFLQNALFGFFPTVIVAALILLATFVIAHFLRGLVTAAVAGSGLHHSRGVGLVTWWAIFIFGFVATLDMLGVSTALIENLITGLIAMLAIAGGLAFGLGGKEHAHRFLGKISEEMKK